MSPEATAPRSPWPRRLTWVAAGIFGLSTLCCGQFVCLPSWAFKGIRIRTCPVGDFHPSLTLDAWEMQRGEGGHVQIELMADYTTGRSDEVRTAPIHRGSAQVFLVDADGDETPLEDDGWDRDGGVISAEVEVPVVPDGDYTLRARVHTPLGDGVVDAPLALYAPALIHVLSDRPLYQPGDTVLLRALALRAGDRLPLDGRPGTWEVRDPSGELLLEERAPAGDWGVVAGSFPLDSQAAVGTWTATWRSGADESQVSFQVEPFTLPRFRIDAHADRAWYLPGQAPQVSGQVVYASGAPVADATVQVDWSVQGDWPAPVSWQPVTLQTDPAGRFSASLPPVPDDLVGQVSLRSRLQATDPAGERVDGLLQVPLSEGPILARAVTGLGEGLVEGFNNRLYLRVTTPDGMPLRDTAITVTRAWDPADPGQAAQTDADGVAALQIDPGGAVNMVLPVQPVRPPPPKQAVSLAGARDLATGAQAGLGDRLALERQLTRLEGCARFVTSGSDSVTVALRVGPDGAVRDAVSREDGLSACVADTLRGRRLGGGHERLLSVSWQVDAPDRPSLTRSQQGVPSVPGALGVLLDEALADARSCLPASSVDSAMPRALSWRLRRGSTAVETRWLSADPSSRVSARTARCVESKLSGLRLHQAASADSTGAARLRVSAAPRTRVTTPQAQTMLGYELLVHARAGERDLGQTTLRLRPGQVPTLRLRATPVLAHPGEQVEIKVLRGPDFTGELPDKLFMRHPGVTPIEAELDEDTRVAHFQLPDDPGWYSVELQNARALVFVREDAPLTLELQPRNASYRPGDQAVIEVRTAEGGQPVSAAVGLFGVDQSLGQLVSLPGPDALQVLLPVAQTPDPAFGTLDGQALAAGRIQGQNAAAATILRVAQIPESPELNPPASAHGAPGFDPVGPLTDRFYTVLTELHRRARAWESSAPAEARATPKLMASLWEASLDACEARGDVITDAYGNRLRLHRLPDDLLALTDPRAVIIDSTRLPEDVDNWSAWVREEEP